MRHFMSNFYPRGFGGKRTGPEDIKRVSWLTMGTLVVSVTDERLTWPERELLQQLGDRLFPSKKRVLQ
jgi:hypothetical protein